MLRKTATWTSTWIVLGNGMTVIWIVGLGPNTQGKVAFERSPNFIDLTLDHKRRAMSFIITWLTWLIWIIRIILHPPYLQPSAKRWPLKGTGLKLEWQTATEEHSSFCFIKKHLIWTLTFLEWIFVWPLFESRFFLTKVMNLAFLLLCLKLVEATFSIRCLVRSHKPGRAILFFEGLASRSLWTSDWKSCLERHIFGTTSPKKSMAYCRCRTLTLPFKHGGKNGVGMLGSHRKEWTQNSHATWGKAVSYTWKTGPAVSHNCGWCEDHFVEIDGTLFSRYIFTYLYIYGYIYTYMRINVYCMYINIIQIYT